MSILCKKCKNYGCNAAGTERTTTDCEDYMSHLQTNADRIRAMTDEELAEWLTLCLWGINREVPFLLDCNVDRWLDWLKQEAQPSGCETIQHGEKADNVFDQCEVHENCTVEVWSNSETGETSIGWWENE